MKKSSILISLLAVTVLAKYAMDGILYGSTLISNSLIWKGNKYAAFTTLTIYDEEFYCAFREAQSHVDMSGVDVGHIVVLRSKDGKAWEKHCVIGCTGYDLRDPQFFVDSEKHLNLLAEKVKYKDNKAIIRESCYVDLVGKNKVHDLRPISFDNNITWNWLWNVNTINGTLFGFTYVPYFALYKSEDGRQYKYVSTPALKDSPTESAIIGLDGETLLAVVRQTKFAAVGTSYDSGKTWHWRRSKHCIDCPKMIHYGNDIILAARNTDEHPHTSLYLYNKSAEDFDVMFDLPDSEDCSYPGIVEKDGYLYISYYQSEKKTCSDIYFAKIKIK